MVCFHSAGGEPEVSNQEKTPTILLLNDQKEFHSFGNAARDHYYNLKTKETKQWYYFEKFKMTLHNNEVSELLASGSVAGGRSGGAGENENNRADLD